MGRWVGDITFIADWPGQTKKQGDKAPGYATYKWIADKRGIECEDFVGNTTGKTIMAWEGPSKQIQAFHIGSAGMTWHDIMWKVSDNKWAWKNVVAA